MTVEALDKTVLHGVTGAHQDYEVLLAHAVRLGGEVRGGQTALPAHAVRVAHEGCGAAEAVRGRHLRASVTAPYPVKPVFNWPLLLQLFFEAFGESLRRNTGREEFAKPD